MSDQYFDGDGGIDDEVLVDIRDQDVLGTYPAAGESDLTTTP